METQEIKDKAGTLIDHAGDYLDTFYKVNVLKLTKKVTDVGSGVISAIVICVLGLFILFFGGFAAAWWLGNVIASRAGGFLVVAGFFLCITLVIVLLRKKIVFPFVRNMLIRKIYE